MSNIRYLKRKLIINYYTFINYNFVLASIFYCFAVLYTMVLLLIHCLQVMCGGWIGGDLPLRSIHIRYRETLLGDN